MDPIKTTLALASQVENQALNSIVAGFSFASAIAYMDLVRWALSQLVKVNKNGGYYYLMTALLTTLLSVVVFMVVKRFVKPDIKAPSSPIYAVSA
jgi:hypothetical protein